MFIIAGLGNPGPKYDGTRHNMGFSVIDVLCGKLGIALDYEKHRAFCGSGTYEGQRLILAKPQTFMNLSGESIGPMCAFYKTDVSHELLVISDDTDLEFGRIRIRKSGSAGGHNGLKNIIEHLGTQEFMRLKIGVGGRPPVWDQVDWVLSRFPKEDAEQLKEIRETAAMAALDVIKEGPDRAMNRYN